MRSEEEIRTELERLEDFHPTLEHIDWLNRGKIAFAEWVLNPDCNQCSSKEDQPFCSEGWPKCFSPKRVLNDKGKK